MATDLYVHTSYLVLTKHYNFIIWILLCILLLFQNSWKSVGLALDDIRSRFDNARQQLIEEAVAVSRSGGMTSTGNLLKGIDKKTGRIEGQRAYETSL